MFISRNKNQMLPPPSTPCPLVIFPSYLPGSLLKKHQKLKYVFEEKLDTNREPQKFYGYQDDTSAGSHYAIMIYDVIIPSHVYLGCEEAVQDRTY